MSRIPQSPARSPLKPSNTPVKSRTLATATPLRVRTQSTKSTTKPVANPSAQDTVSTPLTIKEAIALRRAEAKKTQSKLNGEIQNDFISLEDASPLPTATQEDEDLLGRLPVRETIERARSTGSLNLATRSLPCIPSALFEIHLGITPDPLKSVPNEPALPPSAPVDVPRRGGKRDTPAWFEAQDLQVLKLWSNDIVEIQHEISLFGSLKVIDLHKNKLVSLPATFGDLTALTSLNLSHNSLTSLPVNLFALPELTTLNLSYNCLSALPFNAPFVLAGSSVKGKLTSGGSFFTPMITRATSPLPRLLTLDASHNKIPAEAIDLQIPQTLVKLDLSTNPLGINDSACRSLFQVFGRLPKLKELRLESVDIGDNAFPPTLFSSTPFASIRILDLGQTKVTAGALKDALKPMKQSLSFDMTTDDPPEGVACIIVGKKIVKEAWELELERRGKSRMVKHGDDWDTQPTPAALDSGTRVKTAESFRPSHVIKETWELEAEQGLLTEGGKRRARAAAAAEAEPKLQLSLGVGTPSTPKLDHKTSASGFSLSSPQYYSETTQTLTLPPSSPPSKTPTHTRAFSLAAPSSVSTLRTADIAVPSPTLPLSVIASQPFAHTLKTLILVNRRMDKSFALPPLSDATDALLPSLEELDLEGCSLADLIVVTRSGINTGDVTPPRSMEMILPLIARLFPSLQTLNLSHNALTSSSITPDALSTLILATDKRKGLKHLRLRGNRLVELDGFRTLAESFKGNRQVPGWHLEELDIRDNDIGKLLPELGLLPMDVFLVDGNTFRIPQRRIWEREGTKGLLSWLRGRIE